MGKAMATLEQHFRVNLAGQNMGFLFWECSNIDAYMQASFVFIVA